MTPLAIVLILTIAAGGAAGLVFIGVLIQWSLRKALPSRPTHAEIEAAPSPNLSRFCRRLNSRRSRLPRYLSPRPKLKS